MGKSYDEVLAMPAYDVYRTMEHDFEEAEYRRELAQVARENSNFGRNNTMTDEPD